MPPIITPETRQMCRTTCDQLNDQERARVESFEEDYGVAVLEIAKDGDSLHPTLINGTPVDRGAWLEVVRIGDHSCTGTIVGPRCVLTAAHCGRNGGRGRLEIYQRGTINYRIVHMPQYRNGSDYDLAALILDNEAHTDIKPATVGVDFSFQPGVDVDILGYGCTQPGGAGGNDGILRFGKSKIKGFTGTDVITQHRPSGAALCFGDSGGPMFATESRKLVAINSKGNIRDTNFNMRLDLAAVKTFLEATAAQYGVAIYGVTDPGPTPPPPPPGPPPGPAPPELQKVWTQLAKQHRETANFYADLATAYDQMTADNNGQPHAPDEDFGI